MGSAVARLGAVAPILAAMVIMAEALDHDHQPGSELAATVAGPGAAAVVVGAELLQHEGVPVHDRVMGGHRAKVRSGIRAGKLVR